MGGLADGKMEMSNWSKMSEFSPNYTSDTRYRLEKPGRVKCNCDGAHLEIVEKTMEILYKKTSTHPKIMGLK